MSLQTFSVTINAPVQTVWEKMLNHPTYEIWTTPFSEWSTYIGSWDEGAEIKFVGPDGKEGMLAQIAKNDHYAYISIAHKAEMMVNKETGTLETTYYDEPSFENYRFTTVDEYATRVDIELIMDIPEEYVEMFNEMWPKALAVLKQICEEK